MTVRKTLFILFGILLSLLILGAGAGIYYYTHPPEVKGLIEKAVSRATGAPFSIEHLDYSLNPIRINAKGISFQSGGNGFSAEIRDFAADCFLKGRFGKKTLHVKTLRINGFECRVREGGTAVSKDSGNNENEAPSFLKSMAGFFISLFLFKDFRIDAGEMGQGLVVAPWNGGRIQVSGLSAHLDNDHLMHIRGGILMDLPRENTSMAIPDFHVETTTAFSLADPRIHFTFAFPNGVLKSADAKVQNIGARGNIHYDHLKQKMNITGFSLTLKGVEGKSGNFNISGPMNFSGTLLGMVNQGQWTLHCNGNMKKSPVSYRTRKIHINGLMTAQVALEGPVSDLKLWGKLAGDRIDFKEKRFSLKSAQGTINFSGTYPHFHIRNLSCRIPEITHMAQKKAFSVEHMVINATKGRVNMLNGSLNFPEIRLQSPLLSNILATLQMNDNGLKLTAKAKQSGLIRTAGALKLLPPHWTFQGMDRMEVEAVMDKKGAVSFSAALALDEFDFQNPRETCLGENISLQARVSGSMTPPPSTITALMEMDAHGGEVLMDRFYFDLKETPFSAQCNGAYQVPKKRLKLDNLSLEMKKIATAHVTGTLFQGGDGYEGHLSLTIPHTPLQSPFHRLIREPFQTEKPALSKIELDGIIGGKMALKGKRSRWTAKGVFTWKDGSVLHGDSLYTFTGIHLSLPIRLTNVKEEAATQNLEGGLSVRSMKLPFLPEQGLNIPIRAPWNGLFMPDATTLTVPGGTVRVGPSRIIGGPSPVIQSSLHFKNLQLEPSLKGIWPHPVKGTAEGHLDPVHIAGGRFQGKGEIEANIFDGALTLSHVGARGLFTALPVYGLNARWHHLNLAEMTQNTSFGKIEGVLNGYAKKLEISNGQLQRFDLLLETVKTDDTPQKISIKAVDNIARLGGGQSPFVGVAGMFISLFKEFPYEKIGVHATLENDLFRIRGTIREEGREYLVKRGFFSGVDVINQSKDNRVGFKDMLKRIKRITHSKGGPVIQ